jgi:hypothetical protein
MKFVHFRIIVLIATLIFCTNYYVEQNHLFETPEQKERRIKVASYRFLDHDRRLSFGFYSEEHFVEFIELMPNDFNIIGGCGHLLDTIENFANIRLGLSLTKLSGKEYFENYRGNNSLLVAVWKKWVEENKHKKRIQWIIDGYKKTGYKFDLPMSDKDILALIDFIKSKQEYDFLVKNSYHLLHYCKVDSQKISDLIASEKLETFSIELLHDYEKKVNSNNQYLHLYPSYKIEQELKKQPMK